MALSLLSVMKDDAEESDSVRESFQEYTKKRLMGWGLSVRRRVANVMRVDILEL